MVALYDLTMPQLDDSCEMYRTSHTVWHVKLLTGYVSFAITDIPMVMPADEGRHVVAASCNFFSYAAGAVITAPVVSCISQSPDEHQLMNTAALCCLAAAYTHQPLAEAAVTAAVRVRQAMRTGGRPRDSSP